MEIRKLFGRISAQCYAILFSRLIVFIRHVLHLRHLCSQQYYQGYPYITY